MEFVIEVYADDDKFIANMIRKYAKKLLATETDVGKLMAAMERFCDESVQTWLEDTEDYVTVQLIGEHKRCLGTFHMCGGLQ